MPTYEYQCDSCRREFEIRQRISDPPLASCDACGGPVRRLLSAAPFILKGNGWYVTDYPSESRKKGTESEKSASSASSTSSGDTAGSTEKSAAPATGSTAPTPSANASSSAPSAD